jgi:hypothetical protein
MSDDEEILPSMWSGNYITLAPGENAALAVSCPETVLAGKSPYLRISGWNTEVQEILLSRD